MKQNSKKTKNIPKFTNEKAERVFWEANDSIDYVDWDSAETVIMPNLKPSTKNISLRLNESMYNQLKLRAHKLDVPYQSLIKIYISEKLAETV